MDRLGCMETFVKVVDCGQFSAAARALALSASQVTTQVQQLEQRLGVRLLNRTTRKISLTEVGRAFYAECARILAQIEQAERSAQALQQAPRGTLRINCSVAMSPLVVPFLAEFSRRYPEIAVNLAITDDLVDLIQEQIDVAIHETPPASASLISRRVATYRYVVCGSPDYLARRGVPRQPADLMHHDCLRASSNARQEAWRFNGPQGEQAVTVSGSLQTNSTGALRIAALQGQGLCMVPDFVVADDLRAGRLVAVLDEFLEPEHAINVIYPHRQYVAAKVRSFIDLFAASSRQAGARSADARLVDGAVQTAPGGSSGMAGFLSPPQAAAA